MSVLDALAGPTATPLATQIATPLATPLATQIAPPLAPPIALGSRPTHTTLRSVTFQPE